MNEIKIFENAEFGSVRTAEIDGKPYFAGKDIASALGYAETAKAIREHCKGGVRNRHPYKWRSAEDEIHQ